MLEVKPRYKRLRVNRFKFTINNPFFTHAVNNGAVKLVEDAAFSYGLNRIQILCNTNNVSSAGVAKRLKYHLDGTLRQDHVAGNGFGSTFVFSKLRSEWQS